MANEIGGMGLDELTGGGEMREDMNKVTEEAVRRVQDNQKKAQQVGQEIKKDKSINNKFAIFLAFLLRDIKNDHVVKQIYHTFFKTMNEEMDLAHLKKNANINIVVGIFIPFYQHEIKELELDHIYQDIRAFDGDVHLTKYITYIKNLLSTHHNNITIDKQEFIKLLTAVSEYYQLTEKLTPEKAIEFENTIKKELSLG